MKKIIIYSGTTLVVIITSLAIYARTQPNTVAAIIYIDAPQEKVWAIWSKFDNVADFVPMVHDAYTVGDVPEGLGHARRCNIAEGIFVEEKITAWNPGQSYAMEVYQNEGVMIDKMLVDFNVKKMNTGTLATIRMDYKMQGIAAFIPVHNMMTNQALDHLVGIKHITETGKTLTADLIAPLREEYESHYKVLP